jgi:hypothetical protein
MYNNKTAIKAITEYTATHGLQIEKPHDIEKLLLQCSSDEELFLHHLSYLRFGGLKTTEILYNVRHTKQIFVCMYEIAEGQ